MHDQSSTNTISDDVNNIPLFPDENDVDDNDLRAEGLIHRRSKRENSIIQSQNDGQVENNGPRAEALIHPNVLKAWLKRIEVFIL